MKEYAENPDMQSGQVREPLSAYVSLSQGKKVMGGISSALLDELLHQSNDVKLLIIQKLSESMMSPKEDEEQMKEKLAARRKEIEAKLDELHVTGSLRRLIGAFPSITDEEMEAAKDEYFKEKYGL